MAEYDGKPLFRGANGGLSDDIFTGIDRSFYDGKNCDVRSNAQGITISKAMIKDTSTTIVEKINVIVKTDSAQWVAFGNSGGIYVKNSGTWAKVTTSTPAQPITGAAVFQGYLYWATSTAIHRIAKTNIATRASEVIGRDSIVLNDVPYHPMYATSTILAVGNGNVASRVGIAGDWLDVMTLESNTVIKIIKELGGTVRLYCSKGQDFDQIYLRDGVKTDPDQVIPLRGFYIYQAEVFEGVDYVVTNRGIGYIDGYKRVAIKKGDYFNSNLNSICVHDEKIYIGGTGGVYVYGRKNKNYAQVLNFEYYTSNGNASDVIGAMTSDGTNCFVAWSNGSTYAIDLLSASTYGTTSYLTLRGFYGNSLLEVKGGLYIRVGFKPLITGESITISYSLNGGAYTALSAITPTSDKKTTRTTHQRVNGQFQYILFKIDLVGPGTSTPEFNALDFYYDTMLD